MPKKGGRILFLDIDGVLNDSWWLSNRNRNPGDTETWNREQLDPSLIERLNLLQDKFNFTIILSSSWRSDGVENVQRWMSDSGFRYTLDGATPILHIHRGLEIQAWMSQNGITEDQIVILDDDMDMEHLIHRLVKTNFRHQNHPTKGLIRGGLQDDHVLEIAKLICIGD